MGNRTEMELADAQIESACLLTQNALPEISPGDSVSLATPFSTGKRGIVPKRRFQAGTFVKRGDNWVGMWRVDVVRPDGSVRRDQRSKTFVGLSERAARQQLQPILDAVNAASGATAPVPEEPTL